MSEPMITVCYCWNDQYEKCSRLLTEYGIPHRIESVDDLQPQWIPNEEIEFNCVYRMLVEGTLVNKANKILFP